MTASIRIDFHCHSTCSDGSLSPEMLADRLAAGGVAFAALADHDTLDGLDAFRNRLTRHGVGCISGAEITTRLRGHEAHLLAYGFDPDHPELRANLAALRHAREPRVESIAGSVRHHRIQLAGTAVQPAPDGTLETADAIALIHRAGGSAYLAHPLLLEPDPARLDAMLPGLKAAGLDGIEALYSAFRPEDQAALCDMARRHGLLVCAGTDFHHQAPDTPQIQAGIDMPVELWKAFRDAVLSGSRPPAKPRDDRATLLRPRRMNFIFRIVLPAVIAMLLFAVALTRIILPAIERSLLDRKREMIRELVNSAWGILAEAEEEVQLGLVTPEKSRDLAKRRIAMLHYGQEGKDYFWLQDMHPRIIMHPYRPELVGQDVSDFRDPRGVRIFVEFADLVRRQDEGFMDYVWQWKDDPRRLVPKESYIRGFKPWGWIIGTGIYIEDVRAEIARFERRLIRISAGIAGLIALLLLTVIRQSLNFERKRREAEESLHESTERYRTLVEAATEGTLLVVDRRCRYANPALRRRLGYDGHEIELLELADLLPASPGNERAWDIVLQLRQGEDHAGGIEAVLQRRDGRLLECLLAFSRISYAGRDGLIIQARDIIQRREPGEDRPDARDEHARQLADAAANVPVGLVRARALRRAVVLEVNRAACELLPALGIQPGGAPPSLADVFPDTEAFDDFMRRLERDGTARHRLHPPATTGPVRTLALDARLMRDAAGDPRYIDGRIEDITADAQREAERESLIERLQTSLLYLHEPVDRLCHPPAFCTADTPVSEAAALMTAQDSEAALVRGEHGRLAGIVTDRVLRARIVAKSGDPREPVRRIMRESVITIPRHAQVYEALLLMQEKGVEHLAVTDDSGGIVGLIHSRDILQLHSSEAAVLTRKISDAATAEEAIRWCRRAPVMVRALLDSGAHPRQITRMVTAICDAATRRFLALAEAEQGPAPCPFVFLALGSQGRQEMSLFADQDNAILYEPESSSPDADATGRYFLTLGQQVCTWLDAAGYPFCRGSIMARNPKWCAPLSAWQRVVTDWIRRPEPQQVLESAIFLDFRPVYGKEELARALRQHVNGALKENPAFLPFLARDLLRLKPPTAGLSRLLRPRKATANLLDMKAFLMPLSGMARVYALHHELDETHTLDRLEALARRALITEGNLRETAVAYELLLRLRLNHQAECLREGRPLDNTIDWRRLARMEQTQLKQAFDRISAIQKKVSYDFLGGT
jgi:PAS domain S-box-containing protein